MNKKRVFTYLTVAVLTVCICLGGLLIYDRSKTFECGEKNSFAMGTIVSQKVYAPYAAKEIEKGNLLINALENAISRNRENSLISQLNAEGTCRDGEVSRLISLCSEISQKTNGAFDITVGGVVDLWDFGGENEGIPEKESLKKALSAVGYENLSINAEQISLSSEAQVDLGAVGKGLACDSVISLYKAVDECEGAIVSVGGSIGCFGSRNKKGDSWRIGIRHPREENSFIGVITLDEGFVSTSGDYEKYFTENNVRYHHILDARTGYPASSELVSVTVICDSGFLSDALSTACFILGADEGEKLVNEYGASAIFIDGNLEITTVGEVNFEKQ